MTDGPTYAGFFKRFIAWIIDQVIVCFWWAVAAAIGITVSESTSLSAASITKWVIALCVIIPWVYYAKHESSDRQATIGKRFMGIAVTDSSGNRVSFIRASIRYWMKIISTIPLGIGYLTICSNNKRRRAWHDVLSGTCVEVKRVEPVLIPTESATEVEGENGADSQSETTSKMKKVGLVFGGLAIEGLGHFFKQLGQAAVDSANYSPTCKYCGQRLIECGPYCHSSPTGKHLKG